MCTSWYEVRSCGGNAGENRPLTGMFSASEISSSESGGTKGSGFQSSMISSISRLDKFGLDSPWGNVVAAERSIRKEES